MNKMKAWILDGPNVLSMTTKPIPAPGRAEVLIRIDAVAICATDLKIIRHGPPALIRGGLPFNKGFTPGHEYMGRIVALGPDVDEYAVGQRVAVEIHAGCGQCKRCREGMYTACLNYGMNYPGADKGHRANGFTTDGGFAEYAVNHINTLVPVADAMSDEEATLVVTAGTAMYALTEMGGLVAGEAVGVIGDGPIGLLAAAIASALGAKPVILSGLLEHRLTTARALGAHHVIKADEYPTSIADGLTYGHKLDYVLECSGTQHGINDAIQMVSRGGRVALVAFPQSPVEMDVAHIVSNNISLFGIRGEGRSATHRAQALMAQKRFDATLIHTHTFSFEQLPEALRAAEDRKTAIKVIVTNH
jgi:L-iditol 2-dehydrogenase